MKLLAHLLELVVAALGVPVARVRRLLGMTPTRITIVGWWGSETVGDEAILGQLLHECSEVRAGAPLALVSFNLRVSRRTLLGLGRADVVLVPVGGASGWLIASSRCVIYGGGPLLESDTMPLWAARSALARAAGARVMLYACGIGPIRTKRTAAAVRSIVRLADTVVVRDEESATWARNARDGRAVDISRDPAFNFVQRAATAPAERSQTRLALLLRTPPRSALGSSNGVMTGEDFLKLLASSLNTLLATDPVELVGCVMYSEPGDASDHDVYRRLAAKLAKPDRLRVAPGYHSIEQVVQTLQCSAGALTVRFHGMVFAIATETPFVAVDYEVPSGKVSATALLERNADAVIKWADLDEADLTARLRALMTGRVVPTTGQYSSASEIRRRALQQAIR